MIAASRPFRRQAIGAVFLRNRFLGAFGCQCFDIGVRYWLVGFEAIKIDDDFAVSKHGNDLEVAGTRFAARRGSRQRLRRVTMIVAFVRRHGRGKHERHE